MKCPSYGCDNREGAKFCGKCARLTSSSRAPGGLIQETEGHDD
jgi:hypothetical protein